MAILHSFAVVGPECQFRDGVAQASEHVVEWQQGAATELDRNGLLLRAQYGAVRRVGRRGPAAPPGRGGAAQAVAPG